MFSRPCCGTPCWRRNYRFPRNEKPRHEEDLLIAQFKKTRRNDEITATEVRVIDSSGEQIGIRPLQAAIALAQEADMDLVELVPNAEPPVCRIMDYGKFLFKASKQAQAARRKQKHVHVKEIKFRPGTEEADYQVKMRKVREFIESGDKVKVSLRFRGREMAHQELGTKLLRRVEEDLGDEVVVEQRPQMEGRVMVMMLSPPKH